MGHQVRARAGWGVGREEPCQTESNLSSSQSVTCKLAALEPGPPGQPGLGWPQAFLEKICSEECKGESGIVRKNLRMDAKWDSVNLPLLYHLHPFMQSTFAKLSPYIHTTHAHTHMHINHKHTQAQTYRHTHMHTFAHTHKPNTCMSIFTNIKSTHKNITYAHTDTITNTLRKKHMHKHTHNAQVHTYKCAYTQTYTLQISFMFV